MKLVGMLLLEKIGSIDELTDGDFLNASRSVQLPALPEKVDEVIGANGKPVVIKKNIFEKNRKSHKDVSPAQSREILLEALYKPTMYGQNQKTKRPYNWILIHNAVKHSSVVLEVNHNKDNVEVVNWHYLEDDTLEQKKRQAINEGGLILTLESAAGNTINGLSSENKDTEFVSEKQADGDKSSETNTPTVPRMDGYTIESRKDTRDNSDLFAVKFDERVSKDEFKGQKEIAKKFGGYWSNFGKKGFLFKSEESAHDFAETVMGRTVEEVEDEAPISIASITKKNDPNAAEYNGETYYIGDEVILNGIRGRVVAINRWKCPVVQTEHATIALRYNGTDDLTHYVESEEEIPNNKTNGVSKPEDPYHTDEERAHYEELKKRMRAKLNQLNSGIDPELLEIGVEMAFFHFKGGMRHFADFCKTMIEDCGDKIRPHLKMLYNAAAGTEDFIVRGWDEEMDDRKTVRDFDVYNFDKSTVDVIETAQHVVEEAESMQQGEQISFKQLY